MGQYKVPQNVESEDKIIGPLTFKQFIYALIGVAWAGICFAIFRTIPVVFIIVGIPPALLFMCLAFYQKDGQNFEQLLAAVYGFIGSPRKRVWMKDEVIVGFKVQMNPKVVEQTQRNSAEVRSELEKLGTLIDARGWNGHQSESANPNLVSSLSQNDRLVAPVLPAQPNSSEPQPAEDVLDLQRSPLAQNLAALLQEAAGDVRQEAIDQMHTKPHPAAAAASISGVTSPAAGNILKLATERDDLTVSQLAATATRSSMAPNQLAEGQSVELRNNGQSA
jgi:hypothetical protein